MGSKSKGLAVWLDDERPMPPHYDRHAKTAAEAIELLKTGEVEEISLDHDLGPEWAGTGYDVACYIERAAHEGTLQNMRLKLHTANPVGRERMAQALRSAKRVWLGGQDE